MSSINLSGNLLDPNGLFSVGDKVRFTHQTTTGDTIKSAVSIIVIPPDGSYSLNLQYGQIKVEYRDVLTGNYKSVGVVTVNGDSVATTLPQLLNAIAPPTPTPGAVPEAPVNGKLYGRKNAAWEEIVDGGGAVNSVNGKTGDVILEANDIQNFSTTVSSNTDVTTNTAKVSFPEAPEDGKQYARKDAAWDELLPIQVVTEFPSSPDANTLYIKVV